MAQHDYVIDNQGSSAARTDINNVLQAIVSQNSGSTAPSTTVANMIWYDTANDLLKMRNETNTGWITLGTVDQTNNVFNPNFLPATQAEAEAGTNNVKEMTPLRVSQAITALAIPTTTQVLNATAGLTAGGVGTYAFCAQGTANFTFGGTYAGSSLFPASTAANATASTTALTGTWRSLGFNNSSAQRFTVYVRIS